MRKRVRGGERDCGSLLDSKVTSNLAFSFFDLDLLLFPSYFSFLFFETALSLYLHNDVRKTEKKQRTTIVLSTGKKQGGAEKATVEGTCDFLFSLSLSVSVSVTLSPSLFSLGLCLSFLPLSSPSLYLLNTRASKNARTCPGRCTARTASHPPSGRTRRSPRRRSRSRRTRNSPEGTPSSSSTRSEGRRAACATGSRSRRRSRRR